MMNHITKSTRAEWIAQCDFTAIVPVDDDTLVADARASPGPEMTAK